MFILYIDPGSGSLLFQAFLSGLLTIVVYYKRIVAFLKFKFGKNKSNAEDENKVVDTTNKND
jgi:hypothetical protein